MPRETFTAPDTLPLFSTSGASRTSTTRVLPLAIISRACAGVIRGTAALAASIICLTLVAMASSSFPAFTPVACGCTPAVSGLRQSYHSSRRAAAAFEKRRVSTRTAPRPYRPGFPAPLFTLPQRLKTGHKFSRCGADGHRVHPAARRRATTRGVVGGPARARREGNREQNGQTFWASIVALGFRARFERLRRYKSQPRGPRSASGKLQGGHSRHVARLSEGSDPNPRRRRVRTDARTGRHNESVRCLSSVQCQEKQRRICGSEAIHGYLCCRQAGPDGGGEAGAMRRG